MKFFKIFSVIVAAGVLLTLVSVEQAQATEGTCECSCYNPDTGNSWPAWRDIPADGGGYPEWQDYCESLTGDACGGANCPDCKLIRCKADDSDDFSIVDIDNPQFFIENYDLLFLRH